MTTSSPALASDNYTPLERLLLFQSLQAYGVEQEAFPKISESLQSNPVIRDNPAFNPARLLPLSLKDVYLKLLKEEERHEIQNKSLRQGNLQNGESGLDSTKRKAPSPHLPSVQEAAQHAHLVPRLIAKLYARYQEGIIRDIREQEQNYARLRKEVSEIEGRAWDERKSHVTIPPDDQTVDAKLEDQSASGILPKSTPDDTPATGSTLEQGSHREQEAIRQPSRGATSIDALINHPTPASDGRSLANGAPYPLINTPNGAANNAGVIHPPSTVHRIPSQSLQNSPRLPPPLPSSSGYGHGAPTLQQGPHSPAHPPTVLPPSHAPQNRRPGAAELPSPSSRTLPPPPGMQLTSHNGFALPPHLRDPYYRLPSATSPPHAYDTPPSQRYPVPISAPQRGNHSPLPSSRAQLPPQQNYYAHPSRTNYTHYAPPPQQSRPPPYYPPRQGGIMLPPFQVTPQEPNRKSQQSLQQASIASQTRPPPRAPQHAPAPSAPTPIPALQWQQPAPPDPRSSVPRIPETKPTPRPTRLTTYKPTSIRPEPLRPALPDERPDPEAVSPLLLPSEILRPVSPVNISAQSNDQAKPSEVQEAIEPAGIPAQASLNQAAQNDSVRRPKRTARQSVRARRAGSVASSNVTSSVGGRTRSQSVALAPDKLPAQEGTAGARTVKPEPSTPAPALDQSAPASQSFAASHTSDTAPLNRRKRKRGATAESDGPESPSFVLPATTNRQYVLCSRNFHKMSQPIMHDIQSHKHGSLFSNPVKEKDAQGYTDIIRRPQDLKSIRAAIAAGGRAVAAATAASSDNTPVHGSTSSPGGGVIAGRTGSSGGGGNVLLPISPDLVPPRGIVNSAQLEKELMRMFANAIMFNPGDDGVVQDAREMFGTTVRAVESWRSAERRPVTEDGGRGWGGGGSVKVDDDADELAGAGEEGVVEEEGAGAARKRRRG